MKLLADGIELAQRPEIGIFFGGNRPFVVQVVRDSSSGNELEISETTPVLSVHNRIEDDVHRVQMQANNRPEFRGDAPGLPVMVIYAELEIQAVERKYGLWHVAARTVPVF